MIDIPNEIREYMDISGIKPKIRSDAPENVRDKALEIDKNYFNLTGRHYFSKD